MALVRASEALGNSLLFWNASVGVLDGAYQSLADQVGAPVDYVKLFSLLLGSLPLAAPLPYLPTKVKHVTNIIVSWVFLGPVLHLYGGYAQLVASASLTYAIVAFGLGGRRMPWIVMCFQMGHLLTNHIIRQFGKIPLTTMEISAMQMVMVMNLTTFAWDCYDGQYRPLKDLDAWQRKARITKMPSLLEFFGYVFYFPGVLIGPATRFVDYKAWADGKLCSVAPSTPVPQSWTSKDAAKAALSEELAPVPTQLPSGRWARAVREVILGLLFTGIFMTMGAKYDYLRLAGPVAMGGVRDTSFGHRMLFVQLAGFLARTKYYGVWSMTDAACVVSGLGFNGYAPAPPNKKTGRSEHWAARWDRCLNVDILHLELANNWKEVLDHWNINTNIWLRNNVYKRLVPTGAKPGFAASMLTFLTSAFWHGVAPGYYLAFVLAGLFSALAKNIRRHLRPLFFEDPRTPNPSLRRARARRAQAKVFRDKLMAVTEGLGDENDERTAQELREVVAPGGTPLSTAGTATPTVNMVTPFPLPNGPDQVPSLRQLLSNRTLFTSVGPRYTKGQLLYSALSIAATQATLNFTVAPFLVLDWQYSTAAYAAARWYGLYVAAVGLVAFQLGLGRQLDRWVEQRRKRLAAQRESPLTSGSATPACASSVHVSVSGTQAALTGPNTNLRQSNPLGDVAGQADDKVQNEIEHAEEKVQTALDKI